MVERNGKVILRVEGLHLSFGGVKALNDVSFDVKQGEIFAVIGPNGAGKTCTLNCINGFYRAQQGEIYFEGNRITKLRPDKIAQLGISRTFQNIQLYTGLTVVDNLMAARHFLFKSTWLEGAIYFGRAHREEVQHRWAVEEIIDFLELERWRKAVVGTLPYGVRKRVDLGRALAQEPKLLLLDEPMAGMNAEEKEDMARFILDVQEQKDITTVLIEHDMGVVMDITDRICVLDFGRKIAEGKPEEIRADPAVINAYLGGQ
ncbi:MAG: ABC transporter ATP-binding protein [Chloroflexi bacterium]|nr:MAG: ABC transporter ATP-binding protein [Chloroflexota bacterium]RLC97422.1 MAG: ABC transporter ATP-binding protein [Chloroflexota bacterium]